MEQQSNQSMGSKAAAIFIWAMYLVCAGAFLSVISFDEPELPPMHLFSKITVGLLTVAVGVIFFHGGYSVWHGRVEFLPESWKRLLSFGN